DIDNVTIWGLTDNRSWRADQAPLLFDAYFQAKPAFFGALTGGIGYNEGGRPDWNLPDLEPVVRAANVFGAAVPLTQAGWDAQIGLLPLHSFATGTGGFTLRWTADALYVLADLPVADGLPHAPGGAAGRRVGINFAGLDFIVWPNGVVTDAPGNVLDLPGVSSFAADTAWIIRIENAAVLGADLAFEIVSIEGSQQSPQAHIWDGEIMLRENLSVTEVLLTDVSPTFDSAIWDDAATLRTEVNTAGAADGATADVRTVWVDGGAGFSYLYVLAQVNDDTPDYGNAARHENDSVEVFLSLVNNRGASYEHLYDLQARFHRNGEIDINGTPDWVHAERVARSQVREVEGGYEVLAAIRLATDTGHLQGNWNSAFGNVGEAFGFDVQVNDARNGTRYSAMIWADPTGQSWMSTYRWGVARLVSELSGDDDVYVPSVVSATPTAVVERLSGNQNRLIVTVTELLSDGTSRVSTESLLINNNASVTVVVGEYRVFVNTQGNTQIREIRIVG
ncbi:MAG: endo-1,4-beta-xylanase, partial [Promicromonosporaceae bacterium]|nr:endo-1,4-beta-xylanase [Promicromonosporaceae bacterium]